VQGAVALLHVNDFWPLVAGRFVSGVATSFLSTCYECWMVSEHNRRGFPPGLLGSTFSAYVFLMGLVAVASGAVAGAAGQSKRQECQYMLVYSLWQCSSMTMADKDPIGTEKFWPDRSCCSNLCTQRVGAACWRPLTCVRSRR
jgi:hypothetical protein